MRELIFGLIGGTALLMYGVDKMGDGLEKASGQMMKRILSVLTGNIWSAFFMGILLTALVQSSTAITVLTVGFVNAGLMNLSQAVGIIYGANIGTTVTAQLMAFSFKFKLTEIALPVIGIGFGITYFSKKETVKNIGNALMGFGLMFLGLKILNSGVPYIQNSEGINSFFKHYASIPIVGILLGAGVTALVHSSAATVGLVLVLAQAGLLDLQTSICIMLGDNIGTCITAQLASLTGNINARRTAWAHTLYNLIGVVVTGILLHPFMRLIELTTLYLQHSTDLSLQIANSHTMFNVLSAVVFLPLNKQYVKFLETVIRDKKEPENTYVPLDKLLLDTPIAAIKAVLSEIIKATEISRSMIKNTMDAFYNNDLSKLKDVEENEEVLNRYQKDITSYIVELTKQPLTEKQSLMIPALINCINNIERIGDHTIDWLPYINNKINKNLTFSEKSINELNNMENVIFEMLDITVQALTNNDSYLKEKIDKLEDKVDELSKEMQDNHLVRLKEGRCSIESGVIFLDMINHFERIADHIYNVNEFAAYELLSIKDEISA